jgi:hypothetical protein
MNTGISGSPYQRVWPQFYKATLFEPNANKVSDRIAEAETALVTLVFGVSKTHRQRQEV